MNSLLKKTLCLILITVLLSAGLTMIVFRVTGTKAYADIKLDELLPRAIFLADRTAEFMQGMITKTEYEQTINSDRKIWDAEPYIYNSDGTLIAYSTRGDYENDTALISKKLSSVLAGTSIGSFTIKNGSGVMVGTPVISVYGTTIGAVFLVKPLRELNTTLSSLVWALAIAMLLSVLIMIVPSYIISRRLTGPLKTMNTAALAMAQGNFGVRAHEKGKDEIAQLGRSLNALSGALSSTIGELTFERNRLRRVLNGLGEGVVAVNEHGAVMQYNPAALTLMGCDGDKPETAEVYRSIQDEINRVLGGEETETAQRAKGERTLRFTISALRDSEGVGEGALVLVQDVTESVRLEQTRRDYVANVSHELRTPLASIRSLSDALCDGLIKKDEDRLRYYGYIQKETIRLSRLIDDLLELSRLQSGAIALTKQKMAADELIYDVAERFGRMAKEHGIEIKLQVPEDLPEVYSNPDRAEQVLVALIDNAIKHSGQSGSIVAVKAKAEDDRVVISVENAGEIAETDIEHIFERFYKADKSHSGEGTGLGLSISKEIMELLGEKIWAQSAGGTVTFGFTLKKLHPCVETGN